MRPAPEPRPAALDRAAVRAEMEQARLDFRQLVTDATAADLRRRSDGTKWTNQELLFHMLFGYLIVRALLVLARVFSRLPDGASKAFARLLDSARKPFHLINYLGSRAGARIIPPARMPGMLDHVITALQHHLTRETGTALRRGMHYPVTWDPFFTGYMTLADLYRYPTRHYSYHRSQLTTPMPHTDNSRSGQRDTTRPSCQAPPASRLPSAEDRADQPGRAPRQRRRTGRNIQGVNAGQPKPGKTGVTGLTSSQARHFYDWFGRAQDLQAFYEDRAAGDLLAHGRLDDARAVFELGCGTGRLAARLLGRQLPPGARYLGADISGTMTRLSMARLRRFGPRAAIIQADGTWPLPLAAAAFDRFLAVYVLDLLSPGEATAIVAEARRLLRPGGLLEVVSLTPGTTTPARQVSRAWTAAWTRAPGLTGGCRPITVLPLLDGWHIEHRALVSAWALTSEVVVARR